MELGPEQGREGSFQRWSQSLPCMVVPEGSVKAQGPCESVIVTGSCPCQGATQENAGLSIASPNSEVVSGHITQQAFGSAYNSCELTGTCKVSCD